MKNIFTEHPNSVGESYTEHMFFAILIGLKLILWGIAAIVHALFPFVLKTFVSSNIKKLHDDIFINRMNK
tara:strand:+ start:1184 stop:1393 length:210 start_codon:yes stop_codon:yes gene_type:complete